MTANLPCSVENEQGAGRAGILKRQKNNSGENGELWLAGNQSVKRHGMKDYGGGKGRKIMAAKTGC